MSIKKIVEILEFITTNENLSDKEKTEWAESFLNKLKGN